MRNQDVYFDFKTNPDLADALAGVKAGETIKCEVEVLVKGVDANGLSGVIDKVVPDGYEGVEGENDDDRSTPPPPNPVGNVGPEQPVMTAMSLRRKGSA